MPIVICVDVEEGPVESPEAWAAARERAVDTLPPHLRPAPNDGVPLLFTGQRSAAENGVWLIRGDGAHRRP